MQNLLTCLSAFRLASAPVKSVLYIEPRVNFPKIYKLDQVIDLLKMLCLMISIQIRPTLPIAQLKRLVIFWLLPDSASPLLLLHVRSSLQTLPTPRAPNAPAFMVPYNSG